MRLEKPELTDKQLMLVEEFGLREAEAAMLAAGCYGSVEYMRVSYGYDPEWLTKFEERIAETPAYMLEEYGIECTTSEVVDALRILGRWMSDEVERDALWKLRHDAEKRLEATTA